MTQREDGTALYKNKEEVEVRKAKKKYPDVGSHEFHTIYFDNVIVL